MNFIPAVFGRKKEEPQESSTAIIKKGSNEIAEANDSDIVIKSKNSITQKSTSIISRQKRVIINGEKHEVDAYQLMRFIKRITQTIGEYKNTDVPFAAYVIPALRKARGDMASTLETHFNIHWQINDNGESEFFV